jgi:ribonucleoside-triphosphate reductase
MTVNLLWGGKNMGTNEVISAYLAKSPALVNENANQGYSMSGMKTAIVEYVLKEDLLTKSPAAAFHRTGALHLHDSGGGVFAPYCHGGDLLNLLMTGIDNPAGTSSNPARHFDVAVDHIVNYLYTIQNEWEGAQALSSFDTLLAPFVRADNLTQRQVEQSIQRMVYNLSYPLRAAMQTPFTNLSFDLVCPAHMANEPAIIGGTPTDDILSDFQDEMDMINIAFCDVMLQGDRDGNPHTFPIPTYGITKEFGWDSKVANKIFDVAAKFGLPYFMNYIGSGMDPSSNRAMCCRLQMDLNEIIEKTKGGLWNTGVNTGSLSVVTINLPQLGHVSRTLSRGSPDSETVNSNAFADMHSAFFSRLNTLLDAARRHNVWKREKIEEGFALGLMPFTKSYLKNFDKFFSTIGVVGMNECCLNMFGKPIWQCENFVESVLSHIHGYCRDMTNEYGYPWNFEETPAEGCSHSLAIRDKIVFPDIITQGDGDGVFYTNSSHIYVGDDVGLGDSLKVQEKFKSYYNGGTLFHIFCGESAPDRDGLKDLIRNICTNTTIPYMALTRAYAVCPGCGVISDLSGVCPTCAADTKVWDRVTGYYRPREKYNPGKQAEFLARKRFEVG